MLITCAILVFINISQMEDDASASFESASYQSAELDTVLAARREDALSHAWLEYGSLLVGGAGVLMLFGHGPKRRAATGQAHPRRHPAHTLPRRLD